MEKKIIIIISLISAVLSLVYVLLNYFGITRYMGLYMFPVESYIKNYKKLDKIGKNRTIISVTATPNQMKKLTTTIKSLLDQTVKVDIISIVIPHGNKYIVPNELKDVISIFRCGEDKEGLNCLIPTVMRENESTTRIITIGSGKIYGKDFIEELLVEAEKYPNKIIHTTDSIDITSGVVFSTEFFDENFLNTPKGIDANKWVNTYFKDFQKQKIKYSENYKSI